MTNVPNFDSQRKSFWKRPEGVAGFLFLAALILGGGYLITTNLAAIIALTGNILYLTLMLVVLAAVLFVILNKQTRNLIWYMFKSAMRKVTGLFVQIDPIGILKSYVSSLEDNLRKLSKQIGVVRGQQRKLGSLVENNNREIDKNIKGIRL